MNLQPVFGQFLKFGIVGLLNTIITLFVFFLLFEIIHLYYFLSSIIAYILGIFNSFFGNKFWTFKSTKSQINSEVRKFILVNILGLTLNALFIAGLVELLEINPFLAQVLTVCLLVILTFSANKFWVFKTN